jgi:hypothetical protein
MFKEENFPFKGGCELLKDTLLCLKRKDTIFDKFFDKFYKGRYPLCLATKFDPTLKCKLEGKSKKNYLCILMSRFYFLFVLQDFYNMRDG